MNKRNIVLIGMPGAGKSTVGPLLAQRLHMDYVDVDARIAPDKAELQKIVDGLGMAGFLALEEETLLSLRNEAAPRVIITGGSAVSGGKAMAWHKENGVLVYLRLPLEILARRVNFESGGLAKAPGQTFRDVFAQRSPLYAALADIAVDVRDKSREEVVDAIMAGIGNAGLWGVQ